MFDTYITVVGTAITRPEWRRTTNTETLVASFRIASNSRRYDKNTESWVDGPSLRVRVNCWRRLAEGVASSVMIGDPVVVHGRMLTRDWRTEQGEPRVSYELEAVSVGHDLSRGRSRFERMKAQASTTVIEDHESESRVGGEASVSVPELNATRPEDGDPTFDDYDYLGGGESVAGLGDPPDPQVLRRTGLGVEEPGEDEEAETSEESEEDVDGESEGELVGAAPGSGGSGGRGRRRGR